MFKEEFIEKERFLTPEKLCLTLNEFIRKLEYFIMDSIDCSKDYIFINGDTSNVFVLFTTQEDTISSTPSRKYGLVSYPEKKGIGVIYQEITYGVELFNKVLKAKYESFFSSINDESKEIPVFYVKDLSTILKKIADPFDYQNYSF